MASIKSNPYNNQPALSRNPLDRGSKTVTLIKQETSCFKGVIKKTDLPVINSVNQLKKNYQKNLRVHKMFMAKNKKEDLNRSR